MTCNLHAHSQLALTMFACPAGGCQHRLVSSASLCSARSHSCCDSPSTLLSQSALMVRRAGCSMSLLRTMDAAARPYCASRAPEQAASSVKFLHSAAQHSIQQHSTMNNVPFGPAAHATHVCCNPGGKTHHCVFHNMCWGTAAAWCPGAWLSRQSLVTRLPAAH